MDEVLGIHYVDLESEGEFDDSELDPQDLVDVLGSHERGFATPYQSPTKKNTRTTHTETVPFVLPEKALDFDDPTIVTILQETEAGIVIPKSTQSEHAPDTEETITLTRAELEAIKRNAFLAGRDYARRPPEPFPFLSLPAELRLLFYSHYFADRNPRTNNPSTGKLPALPSRISDEHHHCCSASNIWCQSERPWISTALLRTCKQIYREARDDFLYKNRTFHAPVGRFDDKFRRIDPNLRFWQYIQHLNLDLTTAANFGARFEAGNLVVHLVALLRGGQNLKSFKLRYLATGRTEAINKFKDLSVEGPVSLTQAFKDWHEPNDGEQRVRKERLERLLFGILGCASYEAPPYDFVSSTITDVPEGIDLMFWETHMTVSTGFD